MDTPVLNKWNTGIKSILLLLLSLFLTQVILSNSFISENIYFPQTSSFSYLFSGFYQFTENKFSPFLFITSCYLLTANSNVTLIQFCVFAFSSVATTLYFVTNNSELNLYLIHTSLFLSLVIIAAENIYSRKLKIQDSRYIFIFLSGIIYGALFANTILTTDLPDKFQISSIAIYSAGLLIGLTAIGLVLYILTGKFLSGKEYYKKWVVNPASILILLYALYQIASLLLSKN